MSLLTQLTSLGKYKTTPFRKTIAGISRGSMLFSFLFKKKVARKVAMKGFLSQGLGLLAIRGVAQLWKHVSNNEEIKQEPIKAIADPKSGCRTWIDKLLGRTPNC